MTEYTDFGFSNIPKREKTERVQAIFSGVASRYDLMNDLMSLGAHRLWKDRLVSRMCLRPGQHVLDVAGGSGDVALRVKKKVGPEGRVYLLDLNPEMLACARKKIENRGELDLLTLIEASAEAIPLPDRSVHAVSIAFGLRNVSDRTRALSEMYRVLKPGGLLAVMEFSMPSHPMLRALYDRYSSWIPKLGAHVAQDEASYRYLVDSIRAYPDPERMRQMILDVGFDDCEVATWCGSIVTLHRAYRF